MLDEKKYKKISQRFTKMVSEDRELSKFSIHQIANFLWYHTAVIIDAHVEQGVKEEMRPLLDLIKQKMTDWKETK